MTTNRLFDRCPAQLGFDATVISCEKSKNGYAVVLDQTAFFPEGGGQGADHGVLGGVNVLDVHDDHGLITHTTDGALEIGTTVHGEVEPLRRLAMTQQHSGEHILTGLIHKKYGYDNVGFHIGTDAVTVDFNGPLTEAQVREMEFEANQIIWRNTPIRAWFPDKAELEAMDYRSKKAIDGDIRIVQVEGVDTCACCGTHVPTAGGVGQIKVINMMNYKGGVRLFILCGVRALEYENRVFDENRAVSRALSAKPGQLEAAVNRLMEERDRLKAQCEEMAFDAFLHAAEKETGDVRVVEASALETAQIRKAGNLLAEQAKAALILIKKGEGWSYALASQTEDMRPISKALNAQFQGKGGGPKEMVQGVLGCGTAEDIRAALEELMK